jgi:hypothetical protein
LTRFVLPDENGLSVKAEGGDTGVQSLVVYPLKSAWKTGGDVTRAARSPSHSLPRIADRPTCSGKWCLLKDMRTHLLKCSGL